MTAYATVEQVEAGFRPLDADEQAICTRLLEEAGVLIDAAAPGASADAKQVVSCRMVRRALGDGETGTVFPLGATQGSVAAGGYTQSWTMASGASGELYLGKAEKLILGAQNKIGAYSPVEGMAVDRNV